MLSDNLSLLLNHSDIKRGTKKDNKFSWGVGAYCSPPEPATVNDLCCNLLFILFYLDVVNVVTRCIIGRWKWKIIFLAYNSTLSLPYLSVEFQF